jgi:hypothetical protein
MVVIIVALGIGSGIVTTYLKTRAEAPPAGASLGEVEAMRQDIQRLKERVRTLEAIVTDKDRVLADEIRKLA